MRAWLDDPQVLRDDLLEFALTFGPKLLGAVAVLLIGLWLAKRLRNVAERGFVRARFDPMLASFLAALAYFALLAFVAISTLGVLGIPTTHFAVVIASAGFAVGFALQGSLGNFAAGVVLLLFKPFKRGDYIEGAGQAGTVHSVGTFMTILTTPDNKRIIIPNGELTSSSIINYSSNPTRRVDLVIGIGYDDDIDRVRAILERILGEDERVLADPAPQIAVAELGDSSVNLRVRPWSKSADYWPLMLALTERIKKAFDSEGITISYPQRDVHMHQVANGRQAP